MMPPPENGVNTVDGSSRAAELRGDGGDETIAPASPLQAGVRTIDGAPCAAEPQLDKGILAADVASCAAELHTVAHKQEEAQCREIDSDEVCAFPTLDVAAFPRFGPFLDACQDYAALSGSRFNTGSFRALSTTDSSDSELELAPQTNGDVREERAGHTHTGARLAAKLRAEPQVNEFAQRLRSGDWALQEELERASRIVMAECVRNSVITTCRRLELWPPLPTPNGVAPGDCSYEDMSAPLDEIAQRAYNDEARRSNDEVLGATGGLARRALTASYLIDFASEVGVPLPRVPETFQNMFAELELRTQEWEEGRSFVEASTPRAPRMFFLDGVNLQAAAERLRSLDARRLMKIRSDSDARAPRHIRTVGIGESKAPSFERDGRIGTSSSSTASPAEHELVVEVLEASDLGAVPTTSKIGRAYVEVVLGDTCCRTATRDVCPDAPHSANFAGEALRFQYAAETELLVQVHSQGWFRLVNGDSLIGEVFLPVGVELKDCRPREMVLPLSCGSHHAGTISLQVALHAVAGCGAAAREELETQVGTPLGLYQRPSLGVLSVGVGAAARGAMGAMVGAVGDVVGAAAKFEGLAVKASLRLRSGFGTCPRDEASIIIVTEEGSGSCWYYPYATRGQAEAYFKARSWRLTSRIMFSCNNGVIGEELCQGGLALPFSTIRNAAQRLAEAPQIEGDAPS
mmetsp:Transcript_42862/g.118508  ORF Transcript_42862/g.118508 Transcript_42862/m.118508 type:complete len:690 (-) Transcript_42862:77-2146(-)